MNKLTILLIVIIIMAVGVAGYIFGSQNSQGVPITFTNNSSDDDSGVSSSDLKKSTKTTIKPKTNTTVKKTITNSTPKTNSTNST